MAYELTQITVYDILSILGGMVILYWVLKMTKDSFKEEFCKEPINPPVEEFVNTFLSDRKRFKIEPSNRPRSYQECFKYYLYQPSKCTDTKTGEVFRFDIVWCNGSLNALDIMYPDYLNSREENYIFEKLALPLENRAKKLRKIKLERKRNKHIKEYCK